MRAFPVIEQDYTELPHNVKHVYSLYLITVVFMCD